jgi:hypothetical protein
MTVEEFIKQEDYYYKHGILFNSDGFAVDYDEFAEAYAKQEIEAISRKEMMSIFSEYINDGNGAIEFHAEYSPKYPFYLISKENYNALQKQVEKQGKLIEAIKTVNNIAQAAEIIKQALKE